MDVKSGTMLLSRMGTHPLIHTLKEEWSYLLCQHRRDRHEKRQRSFVAREGAGLESLHIAAINRVREMLRYVKGKCFLT